MSACGRLRASLPLGFGALVLFGGSVAVVLWQGTRVGALHDLSYILNTAYRIAAGDVPYRDFTQPHPPLTFLVQAAILRLFDSSYAHHLWYAALLSGLGTLLTAAIVQRLLRPHFARASLYAFVACLPLIPLGLHSLFPHPWYDADATFLALLALYAVLCAHEGAAVGAWPALAGLLVVVPVFAKQNMGLALLGAGPVLALPWLFERSRRRRYLLFLLGSAATLALALALIQATCGIENYLRWTMVYAAERRLAIGLALAPYRRASLWLWVAPAFCGLALVAAAQRCPRPARIGGALLLAPLVAPLCFDYWDRLFLRIWPLTLLLALATAGLRWRRERSAFEALFTLTLVLFCHATFLSQGVGGSSFALWPFFCLLVAVTMVGLRSLSSAAVPRLPEAYLAGAVAVALLTGVPQLVANRRLDYLRRDGPVRASQHPRLAGLHLAGDFAPSLDELLAFFEQHVPADETFTALPGEDPLYFALRRPPRLPLVQFDRTVSPWSPEQLMQHTRDAGISWIVVKRKRQLRRQPQNRFAGAVSLALRDYEPVLENDVYLVLRRRR